MYDIVIVGAGPSGATLAKYIDKKYKVLIIDKRELDKDSGKIVKCCGGLLAPDAQAMLAKLGLGVPKDVLVGPQLFTVRTIDYDNDYEKYYQRHYINVDREKFDRWIVNNIPDNVEKEFGVKYKSFRQSSNSITVKFTKNNTVKEVETKILVGADGGFSTIRKKLLGTNSTIEEYASIEEWFEVKSSMPYYTTIFDSSITDFYSWTIPKEDCLIVGSAIPKRNNVNEKFNNLKEKLIRKGYDLSHIVKREGAFILRPTKLKHIYLGNKNVILIGEAAGFISPSSAEGISYGLRSAIALADSINNSMNNTMNEYKIRTKKLKHNILVKNLKSPFMYNSTIRNMVMKSGLLSMNIRRDQ